jgi:hypothetical protein
MKRVAASTPTTEPVGPTRREVDRRIAKPTAEVDDPIAEPRRQLLDAALAMNAEVGDEEVAKLHELVEQERVPGFDGFRVLGIHALSA